MEADRHGPGPVGLVLAGGLGRRLGRSKGDLELGGRTLAARAAETLSAVCDGVLVSVRPGAANPAPGWPAIDDAEPSGRGPLAGIAAGFAAVPGRDLLVLACDYPRVDAPFVRSILSLARADDELVLAVDRSGREHPLCALWRHGVATAVRDALAAGRLAVRGVTAGRRVRRLAAADLPGLDLERLLTNVNRPEDLSGA